MFKRILIANRGEIAVRIQRTCRELGIKTVALYTAADRNSLHVRYADQCFQLDSPSAFMDIDQIVSVATQYRADAIHPGYGFLAERADFIRACENNGIAFIGSTAEKMEIATDKISVLEIAKNKGYPVIEHSPRSYNEVDLDEIKKEAGRLGYPVVIKSCRGGRGRGERFVNTADDLERAVRRAQNESQAVYGERCVYLEKAIMPAHQVTVQILGDKRGQRIHLGEREGSILIGNQKIFEESPAPGISPEKREDLFKLALSLADTFNLDNLVSLEFLVNEQGEIFFTEIKPRIQIDHPLIEMRARLDLVREQIRISAGELLDFDQEHVKLDGYSMECRITAQDPWNRFLPSPGMLRALRLPVGHDVRVDTFVSSGCQISGEFDPLIAKVMVWGESRQECMNRMKRALAEIRVNGVKTNMMLLQLLLTQSALERGEYDTSLDIRSSVGNGDNGHSASLGQPVLPKQTEDSMDYLKNLAVAAAIYYARRSQMISPSTPERLNSGWHRHSRRLPE